MTAVVDTTSQSTTSSRLAIASWLLLLALLAPGVARAQGRAHARALDAFDASETAYARGDFAEAARQLREAYALEPTPVLLYNLGRACEQMHDTACALDAYRSYLDSDVTETDRADVTARIASLTPATPEPATPAPELEATRAPVPAPRHDPDPTGGAVLVAIGAAASLASLAMGIAAVVENDHASAASTPLADALSAEATRDALSTAWPITLVVGLVVAAAGGAWLGVVLGQTREHAGEASWDGALLRF